MAKRRIIHFDSVRREQPRDYDKMIAVDKRDGWKGHATQIGRAQHPRASRQTRTRGNHSKIQKGSAGARCSQFDCKI